MDQFWAQRTRRPVADGMVIMLYRSFFNTAKAAFFFSRVERGGGFAAASLYSTGSLCFLCEKKCRFGLISTFVTTRLHTFGKSNPL